MIRKTLICLVLVLSLNQVQAQRDKASNIDRMQAKKVAYITDAVQLTPEQSEKFWPLYNAHHQDLKEKFGEKKNRTKPAMMSDAEVKAYVDNYFVLEEQKLAEKRKFIQSIRSVISDRQIMALNHAEKKFRKEVFDRFKNRKKGEGKRQRKMMQKN